MRLPDLEAVHWHLIPGGIEFEAEDGAFVHILIDPDSYLALGERITERGLRNHTEVAHGR